MTADYVESAENIIQKQIFKPIEQQNLLNLTFEAELF